jgi:preprotein translocase subunit YajC
MMFTALAYAMGARGEGAGGAMASLVPILLMFVIFYFLLIRPQQKQVKRHRDFVRNLKTGERVVTSGGIHGIVRGLTETTVTLEIADNIRVKVTRSAITGSSQDAAAPEAKGPKE